MIMIYNLSTYPSCYGSETEHKTSRRCLLSLDVSGCAGDELEAQVAGWLRVVPSLDVGGDGRIRGIIAPHAGYSYSGAIMAYAYKHINPDGM